MDVSFDLYKVFYYVCTFKSITKAANHLCVSQPAITKHIKNLENLFECDLTTRTPKGIELTLAGETLFNNIKDSVENLISACDNFINKSLEYTVHISCGMSIARKYLSPALSDFNKKYPNLKVDVGSYYYRDSIQRLRDGKVDLIFLNLRDGSKFGNDLIVEDFCILQDIFAVNRETSKEFPKEIKLIDLNDYDLIIKIGKSKARNFLTDYFEKNGKVLNPKYELSKHWLIEEYIEKGLGIGIVTKEFVEDKLKNKDFIEIKSDIKLPERKIVYAMRKNSRYNGIVNSFLKEIKVLCQVVLVETKTNDK